MKIIKGQAYYYKNEVAQLVNKTKLTVHNWFKLSEEMEKVGLQPLIPLPKTLKNGYNIWTIEQVEEISEFAKQNNFGLFKDIKEKIKDIKNTM